MAKMFENVEETKRMHAKEAYTMLHRATISLLPVLREDQVEEIANRRLGHCDVGLSRRMV